MSFGAACSLCRGVGWVLDGRTGRAGGLTLELIPCPIPDCPRSGQLVELVSLDMLRFRNVCLHPSERFVMSVSRGIS